MTSLVSRPLYQAVLCVQQRNFSGRSQHRQLKIYEQQRRTLTSMWNVNFVVVAAIKNNLTKTHVCVINASMVQSQSCEKFSTQKFILSKFHGTKNYRFMWYYHCCFLFVSLVEDVDLQLMTFSEFGKDIPKTFKLSPDGFVQMAIQLAYYKYVHSLIE